MTGGAFFDTLVSKVEATRTELAIEWKDLKLFTLHCTPFVKNATRS